MSWSDNQALGLFATVFVFLVFVCGFLVGRILGFKAELSLLNEHVAFLRSLEASSEEEVNHD